MKQLSSLKHQASLVLPASGVTSPPRHSAEAAWISFLSVLAPEGRRGRSLDWHRLENKIRSVQSTKAHYRPGSRCSISPRYLSSIFVSDCDSWGSWFPLWTIFRLRPKWKKMSQALLLFINIIVNFIHVIRYLSVIKSNNTRSINSLVNAHTNCIYYSQTFDPWLWKPGSERQPPW